MRIQIAYVSPRRERLKSVPSQALLDDFLGRAARFTPIVSQSFRSEEDLLSAGEVRSGRATPQIILLDSRGRSVSSEQFAEILRDLRDRGTQDLMLAIGPADGWSAAARSRAILLLSLGAITLPHELALVVLAEQTYRALTILAGHPYHAGHE